VSKKNLIFRKKNLISAFFYLPQMKVYTCPRIRHSQWSQVLSRFMHAFLHGLSACLNQKEHRQIKKLKRNDSGVGHPRWEKKKTSPTVQPSEVVFYTKSYYLFSARFLIIIISLILK
jgi:hypothetical protein